MDYNSEWISREYIREYLDDAIHFWRGERELEKPKSSIYIGCFQSIRRELFGEELPWPEDPSPRMIRPKWEAVVNNVSGYLICTCGATLQIIEQTRKHWQLGHFDYVADDLEGLGETAKEIREVIKKYKGVFEELARIDREED